MILTNWLLSFVHYCDILHDCVSKTNATPRCLCWHTCWTVAARMTTRRCLHAKCRMSTMTPRINNDMTYVARRRIYIYTQKVWFYWNIISILTHLSRISPKSPERFASPARSVICLALAMFISIWRHQQLHIDIRRAVFKLILRRNKQFKNNIYK